MSTTELYYLMFELVLTKCISQYFYLVYLGKKGVGGQFPSDLFWVFESELKVSISNQMSRLYCLYEHPFYKNHICPKGIAYNTCPWAVGFCQPRNFYYLMYDLFLNKVAVTKILLDGFGIRWCQIFFFWGGGSNCLLIPFAFKKNQNFQFSINEPFLFFNDCLHICPICR